MFSDHKVYTHTLLYRQRHNKINIPSVGIGNLLRPIISYYVCDKITLYFIKCISKTIYFSFLFFLIRNIYVTYREHFDFFKISLRNWSLHENPFEFFNVTRLGAFPTDVDREKTLEKSSVPVWERFSLKHTKE